MLSNKLFSSIGNTDRLYVDDVFSAYTYTGNGTPQTITNGIDLAGKGGMVWLKGRSTAYHHVLVDTVRGTGAGYLRSNTTGAQNNTVYGVSTFNNNGFTLTDDELVNQASATQVAWTFRKAPKFFDVVTYTGNGAASRSIAHSLGIAPGMLIVKRTDAAGVWYAFHKYDETKYSMLNGTDGLYAFGSSRQFASDSFSVEGINTNGASYVAYLFAHDPSADGIVQCGSFTAPQYANTVADLGWEPQFILCKAANYSDNWTVQDDMRGMTADGRGTVLMPNLSIAEGTYNSIDQGLKPNSTGFSKMGGETPITYIYLAIRRPNKPPTTGTEVYGSVAIIGSDNYDISLPSLSCFDLIISQKNKQSGGNSNAAGWNDRLRGFPVNMSGLSYTNNPGLSSASAASEGTGGSPDSSNYLSGVSMNRAVYGGGWSSYAGVFHAFRRAPGFFDVVCYTGTGGSMLPVTHSLGVVPEMIIVKHRNAGDSWAVYPSNPAYTLALNETVGHFAGIWNSTAPTSTVFHVGTDTQVNGISGTYVAYLFASLPGISKVGSYTGNGSSQTINCGFSTGARFVLIKRTDSTGDWYVWNTARGIIAANDPHLSLNTTAAEVTTNDSVDPDSTGFIVNQVAATNINVTSSTYLYLAIA